MNWHLLRADLNGSQQKAFEEICAQLARLETDVAGTAFVRLGTPDGGVECYRIGADGYEHGWQAKFFVDDVGKVQFGQLTESFERALATHPRLARYTICIPQDRADPRKHGQKFYMDRWNDAVDSWRATAAAAGRSIEFQYWGDHELTAMLADERHAGRRWLWFREVTLTQDWLREQFGAARHDAGERYDPQLNVPVRIGRSITGLLREKPWFDDLNAVAGAVDKATQRLESLTHDPRFSERASAALAPIHEALSQITALGRNPIADFDPDQLITLLTTVERQIGDLRHSLREEPLNDEERDRRQALVRPPRDVRDYEIETVWRLERAVDELLAYLASPRSRLAASGPLTLLGNAGEGKTHLLCDAVDSRIADGGPAILFLGQWFREGDPLQQMIEKLDLDCRGSEFLDAVASLAEFRGRKALLVIDALNEAQPRDVWVRHLGGLLETIGRRRWIGLVVSCRTSYVEDTFPDGRIPDSATSEIHRGFRDELNDAVRRYFDHYGIVRPRTPLVLPEFRNPLFLRIFCRALRDADLSEVPLGMQGISHVFDFFISAVDDKLHRANALNYPKGLRLLQRSIAALADAMVDCNARRLPFATAYAITEQIRPSSPHWTSSLLYGLMHEGVLVSERQGRLEESMSPFNTSASGTI